jgi:hypothetical protein
MYNPATFDYFKNPERAGETLNIKECMYEVYNDLKLEKINNSDNVELKKLEEYSNIYEYPLFLKINKILENPQTPDETSKCDEVFAFYIYKVSKNARPQFFKKIVKYVILFRICLNKIYKEKVKSLTDDIKCEYSELFNPEDAPDISNDFVTDFLWTEDCQFDIKREEAIDITHNFCQWLYDNNFSCSKLSLISNY